MQVGKIAIERLQIAALYIHLASATKDDGAKAVPLGLEQEVIIRRQTLDELGQHGFNRRFDRERHRCYFRFGFAIITHNLMRTRLTSGIRQQGHTSLKYLFDPAVRAELATRVVDDLLVVGQSPRLLA